MIPYENGSDSIVDDCAAAIPGLDWRVRSDPGDGTGVAEGTRYIEDDVPSFSEAWGAVWRRVSVDRHPMCAEDRRELNLMYYYFVTVSIDFEFRAAGAGTAGVAVEHAGLTISVMACGNSIESGYIGATEQLSAMMSKGLPVFPSWDDLRRRGL